MDSSHPSILLSSKQLLKGVFFLPIPVATGADGEIPLLGPSR